MDFVLISYIKIVLRRASFAASMDSMNNFSNY